MELFKTVPAYFMANHLFLHLLKFKYDSNKHIEKSLRRHFVNSFIVSEVQG